MFIIVFHIFSFSRTHCRPSYKFVSYDEFNLILHIIEDLGIFMNINAYFDLKITYML